MLDVKKNQTKSMRILPMLLCLSACVWAHADYCPTSVGWSGWSVTTSEDLWAGKLRRAYSIMNMFAARPDRTWVFNRVASFHYGRRHRSGRDGFDIESLGVKVDGFRIMNGYNKSQKLYDLNDGIAGLEVYGDGKLLKRVSLTSKLGWHVVSLPATRVKVLRFIITGVRPGRVHDLCISGLQLMRHNKPIP